MSYPLSGVRASRGIIVRVAALVSLLSLASPLPAQVQTVRYDLTETPLGFFGLELVADYGFTTEPAEIVKTRFHLAFQTQTTTGSFQAQDIALLLQPPIASPIPGDPGVLSVPFTGADFGWSGTGNFSYDAETNLVNGEVLPAPPGAAFMLYGITYFNAKRLTNPGDLSPLGGRFVNSWIEVDYVLIPEPATLGGAVAGCGVLGLRRRRPRRTPRA